MRKTLKRLLGRRVIAAAKTLLGRKEIDETDIFFTMFRRLGTVGVMIDVGAHHGYEMEPFVDNGWRVIAFEPDDQNRALLSSRFGGHHLVDIDRRAMGAEAASARDFFSSEVSSGISSLSAFHDSHQKTQQVEVTTLDEVISQYSIESIDFLKIDVEGYDFFVLQGLDFAQLAPSAIICEYEDRKTRPLGYQLDDVAQFLTSFGYWTVISEWYPIREYGTLHKWKRFVLKPDQVDPNSWGNLLAVRTPELAQALARETGLGTSEIPCFFPVAEAAFKGSAPNAHE